MSTEEIPAEYWRGIPLAEIEASLARVDAMPIIDNHPTDEILGYDEHGLPH